MLRVFQSRGCSSIDPGVLGDREIELALPEQLLRFLECLFAFAGQGSFRSYQRGWAGGTIGGARRNSRTATPRRGGRGSRSPCAGRTRSAGRGRAARAWRGRGSPWPRSRRRRSRCTGCRRARRRAAPSAGRARGTASTRTMSGSGASAITARCIARSDGLVDVDPVDLGRVDADHRPADGLPRDALVQPVALQRGHRLRVADAGNVAVGIEHDGRRDDRPGQAAAAHFVARPRRTRTPCAGARSPGSGTRGFSP